MTGDETRHTTMQDEVAPSEDESPKVAIVPNSTVLAGPVGVRKSPPEPKAFQKATRLLAGLPRWRKVRRGLYLAGVLVSPVPSFLLWRYLAGPEWWLQPLGIGMVWIAIILPYVYLWEWMAFPYKRAIAVALKASAEPSVGSILDACCLISPNTAPWAEFKPTLIDRLSRVTSPDDEALTDLQLTVLHDIVQGNLLPTGFDTASHCIILNALVQLGDTRTVACLEELVAGAGKPRKSDVRRAHVKQLLVLSLRHLRDANPTATVEKMVKGGGKTCDLEVVRATAQKCLVRLRERLAAESLRASLLRSSEHTSLPAATLLRPTITEADASPPEQLLRAHSKP